MRIRPASTQDCMNRRKAASSISKKLAMRKISLKRKSARDWLSLPAHFSSPAEKSCPITLRTALARRGFAKEVTELRQFEIAPELRGMKGRVKAARNAWIRVCVGIPTNLDKDDLFGAVLAF